MNEENVIERAKRHLEILKLHAAYRDTFESPSGQIVLKHLAKKFSGDTFVAGAPDLSAHKQGRHYVLICICQYMKRDVNELLNKLEGNNE